jgi:hypothetical protein
MQELEAAPTKAKRKYAPPAGPAFPSVIAGGDCMLTRTRKRDPNRNGLA